MSVSKIAAGAAQVLSTRELNRALLARQFLLGRPALGRADVTGMVEHLIGLQAQAPFPPYYGLLSRLDGFRPGDLARLIEDRSVVRLALMRGTIHLVSARDSLPLRQLVQPVIERMFRTNHGKRLPGVDLAELAARGAELVDAEPLTFAELGAALAARWPDRPAADLAQGVRALVPLVQVPPRAVWGKAGLARHTSAQAWLGSGEPEQMSLSTLVRRYLGAFGPASVKDVQTWSGLTGLRAVVQDMRGDLVTFRDHNGVELFDLPDAPRPAGQTPAPVRLVAEFDNLVLSHADRSRVISPEHWRFVASPNGIFPGIVLIDGFAAGLWRLDGGTLTIDLWAAASRATIREITAEAERLLAFAVPEATPDIRITSLPPASPRRAELPEVERRVWSGCREGH